MSAPVPALERALAATLKRNRERPVVDFAAFDAACIPNEEREALSFFVVNLAFIERTSTPNLAALSRCAPVAAVRDCFAAQIHDEEAHGDMLVSWLAAAGVAGAAHPLTRAGIKAAELVQHHAWLGIKGAEILTEHYAAALIDALLPRLDEPCLRLVLEEIAKDERRHKVIAVESVRALREAGAHRGLVARLFGPVVERGTVLYFRRVFGGFLERPCAALALPHREILERALDEVHDALRVAGA